MSSGEATREASKEDGLQAELLRAAPTEAAAVRCRLIANVAFLCRRVGGLARGLPSTHQKW
eukprot:1320534-Alexandrium_andersonii.AAC.1